jgi:integrase
VTVYLPKGRRTYRYDFEWRGRRYFGSTGQSTQRNAEEFERKERVRLERQAGDLSLRAEETPRFQDWAETFYLHKAQRLKRPDLLEREIRVVLEFFGAERPPAGASKRRNPPPRRVVPVTPPFHDLRLGDPIENPEWITAFEEWMSQRRIGGSARNHYRSVLSGMYRVAKLPQYRRATGIRSNPFEDIERDPPKRRRVTLTPEQLRAWIAHASPHVQLALAIGALAPKLRLGNVLGLEWARHIDEDRRYITVADHKGDRDQPEPLVVPVVDQLRLILLMAENAAKQNAAKTGKSVPAWVVAFRGRRVASIKRGLKEAARRAGITYGLKVGGATFHTLRHTMATILAELGVPEQHRKESLGHSDLSTTQIYTHLRPMHLVAPLEQLAGALNLLDAVGKPAGPPQGDQAESRAKVQTSAKPKTIPRTRLRPVKTERNVARRRAS